MSTSFGKTIILILKSEDLKRSQSCDWDSESRGRVSTEVSGQYVVRKRVVEK